MSPDLDSAQLTQPNSLVSNSTPFSQISSYQHTQLNPTQISLAHLILTQINWRNTTHSSLLNSIQLESAHLNSRNWTQLKLA